MDRFYSVGKKQNILHSGHQDSELKQGGFAFERPLSVDIKINKIMETLQVWEEMEIPEIKM